MKQFPSIEKLDTGILYALELASSLSVLFLAFGLIASMANVLTKGSVLTDNLMMQRIWAWTQCIAIDASVAGTIIRTFRFYTEGEKVKTWLYGFLSVLLLFTAAIVSNIEAVQQTLNVTLDNAYLHVFVPVEALIWIRSIAIVLLIVAHAMRHVQIAKTEETELFKAQEEQQPTQLAITPDLIDALRQAMTQVQVVEAAETRQLATRVPLTDVQLLESEVQVLARLLPAVSVQDITAVVSAYQERDRQAGYLRNPPLGSKQVCNHCEAGS
jgi:hypothetical protein